MDFNTIDKIIESFQKRPKRTILILSIVAVIALIGMLFGGYLSELGKKFASDKVPVASDRLAELELRLSKLEKNKGKDVALVFIAKAKGPGTRVAATVTKAVDGDTLRVKMNAEKETLRLLYIDTEESFPGGNKPVTALGKKATEEAKRFFHVGETVTLEFPGNDSLYACLRKYRGKYGRLKVIVYKEGQDYQEHMIRHGFSPYYYKFGYSVFAINHERYTKAERDAQADKKGIWNPMREDKTVAQNYAVLTAAWFKRAEIIETFRRLRIEEPDKGVLDIHSDYNRLLNLAENGSKVTIFADLSGRLKRVDEGAVIYLGGPRKNFHLWIPDVLDQQGQKIVNLLLNRYIGIDSENLGQGYAFITGRLRTLRNVPVLVVKDYSQISDDPP